ncbi:hypothetical protein ASG52_16625 [Methylobacterium sp. Leaf456]|uniref:hypothetical protein n=1 Tax=Methylobacterium sp. Leaf456 TaxID=1736382 RepID=UPI0006F9F0A7|nr:hypothetical protein [Methylobacterium sp. Leaf456]KQT60869.1 hypothetical protein ASG52_16625 [Methylobacterium sp. Leaf456]
MARQAPTLVSGQTLLESTAIFLAALLALVAFATRSDAGRSCTVPAHIVAPPAAAAGPEPETDFRNALLLGD